MVPTLSYIKQKFDYYNQHIFQGRLPQIPICIGQASTRLGSVHYKVRRKPDGIKEFYGFKMIISAHYDMPELEVEDTLIHEMIHLYINSRQLQDSSPHGHLFQQMMNHINTHFGRHIAISYKGEKPQTAQGGGEPSAADKKTAVRAKNVVKKSIVCVSELQDGRTGITISTETRIFQLWDQLPTLYKLKSCKWYVSLHPFFTKYPRSITPKIYEVTDLNALREALAYKDTLELERNGSTIKPIKKK